MGGGGGGAFVTMRAGKSAAEAAPIIHVAESSPATLDNAFSRPVMGPSSLVDDLQNMRAR
jgi:hypothetical protein